MEPAEDRQHVDQRQRAPPQNTRGEVISEASPPSALHEGDSKKMHELDPASAPMNSVTRRACAARVGWMMLAAVVHAAGGLEPLQTLDFAGASGNGHVCGDDEGVGTSARFR